MTTPHQTTKECLIRNFQEQLDSEETFTAINYRSLFNIATDMIIVLYEVETARKMYSDIYASLLKHAPDKMDWFIRKMWNHNFELKLDKSDFDKLLAAIDISRNYGFSVEYAVSTIHDTHGHIIEVQYTPKQSNFIFNSILNYDQVLTAVSEFKDTALIDTCNFGVPEHREIPVMYDLNDMTLEDICEAYLNMGGQPLIIEP
jgi:hypothetical protein